MAVHLNPRQPGRAAQAGQPVPPASNCRDFALALSLGGIGGTIVGPHPQTDLIINCQEGIMAFDSDFSRILDQYSGASVQPDQPQQVEQDFDQVAQQAEPELLEHGLSQAFRSDQTPPFGNMIGQMFGQADSGQRAGMLNQLIGSLGPAVIGSILGGARGNAGGMAGGLAGLGGLLGGLLGGGAGGNPASSGQGAQAPRLSPQDAE